MRIVTLVTASGLSWKFPAIRCRRNLLVDGSACIGAIAMTSLPSMQAVWAVAFRQVLSRRVDKFGKKARQR